LTRWFDRFLQFGDFGGNELFGATSPPPEEKCGCEQCQKQRNTDSDQ